MIRAVNKTARNHSIRKVNLRRSIYTILWQKASKLRQTPRKLREVEPGEQAIIPPYANQCGNAKPTNLLQQ